MIATVEQMTQKIRAAVDAREDKNFLIIARTHVPWTLKDVEEAVRRMSAFFDAGADIVMPAGLHANAIA